MSNRDCNFDTRANTFKNNIYGTGKGKIREAVLMRDLTKFLVEQVKDQVKAQVQDSSEIKILDVGGGQGQIALQLAEMGFDVTLSDISADMLEVAENSAHQRNISNVNFVHSALQDLPEKLNQKYDLVLCHAVFEWLENPKQAFELLTRFCTTNGAISLMFYNQAGQILSNLVYGNFDYIKAGMKAKKVVKLNPQSSLKSEDVLAWCEEFNLDVMVKSGVRCFHDYMRDISKWDTDFDNILKMELEYCQQEPYASIGRYMHLLLQKT
jgi:S-adenosylmethionine-dependent methyltransferase